MAEHADVGVGIDQAGVDVLPGGIENVTAFRQRQIFADPPDLAVLDVYIGYERRFVDGIVDPSAFDHQLHISFSFSAMASKSASRASRKAPQAARSMKGSGPFPIIAYFSAVRQTFV